MELVEAHDRLLSQPADLATQVRFITLYQLILESTLGLTTFRFVTDYLKEQELLPGFVEGYSLIHHDENRHICYGVWFLRESVKSSPEAVGAVREMLRKLLPSVAESLTPPEATGGTDFEALGASGAEIREFALGGLTRRGYGLERFTRRRLD